MVLNINFQVSSVLEKGGHHPIEIPAEWYSIVDGAITVEEGVIPSFVAYGSGKCGKSVAGRFVVNRLLNS